MKINNYELRIINSQSGFSVIEVILAAALFVIFSTGIVSVVLQGFDANRLGSEETIANQYASEGIEAARSIKNQAFTNLVDSAGTGVTRNGSNVWAFSGANNTLGKYTRVITVADVQRDVNGNIVASGGSIDPNTKKITSTVSWSVTPTRNDSVVLNSYMTSWRSGRGGMLVFGDGGTTADTISYRTLDQNTQTWSGTSGTNTVALDTANVSSQLITTSSANFSWKHTVGAQSNRLLVVQVSPAHDTNPVLGKITYNGIAMTQLAAKNCTSSSSSCRDEVWYLLNPPQGSFPISVTQTTAAPISGTAETFYNVNQATPFDNSGTATTTNVTSTTFSISVPSTTTDLVADWYSNQASACNTFTLSSGQTKQVGICNTVAQDSEASTKAGAAGTTTMSWTWSTSQQAADIGIGIKPSTSNSFGTAADVDAGTTNKALRAMRLYASSTRNEKVLISRHYDGTSQYIYGQVWNGTTWGNVQLLANWTTSTFLDVQNFDGTYLSNGNFMVVYSDNSVIPKARIWDGTTWQTQTSLTTLGTSQIPNYIVASARPGSNEVMAAFFTQGSSSTTANTITQYYNGTTWSAITSHGTASITNTKRLVDFVWSGNTPTVGALVFSNSTTDKTIRVRTGTASGGVFIWGTTGLSAAQTNNLGSLSITARPATANEFLACDKDAGATPTIICYTVTHAATPTFSSATTLAAATDTGIQRSFHIGFEGLSGDPALGVYSDNTATPKYKKYTASTSTWDASATSLTALTSTVKSVRVIPSPLTNDIMILLADGSAPPNLYSQVWDGTNNLMYTTPSGYAFTTHGTNGSATTDLWYDFAWDQF